MANGTRSHVALLYRRAAFGLRPGELDQVSAGGYQAAVERLVAGLGAAPDPTGDQVPVPTFTPYQRPGTAGTPGTRAQTRARNATVTREVVALQRWWTDRMLATSTPLREKLALFWHGHFATGVTKVRDAKLMYLQNQLFRTAGAGGFETLTQAVAKDGAMMVWLDTATDKKAHPNENFAREMMELFTLGIGNYTQADVTAAARAFTGWVYDRVDYRYVFRAGQHDGATKTYLGLTGDWNGEDVVHIAVNRPESARFILAKLWSHFAYPVDPTDAVVTDLLPSYGPGLDVGAVLRAIFLHPAFLSGASVGGLVKQPVEYLVGAARALGLQGAPLARLPALAGSLGQVLFNPPNVGGWGQNAYWLDSATAQLRLEIASYLAGQADLTNIAALPPSQRSAAVADLLGLDGWGPTTASALARVADQPRQLTALALVAPEYVLA
jgi:uncharacterized protein (DUF1800 family)